jgi:hypothetical protein
MRWDYKDLMEKLGVDRELMAYETQPWMFYDEDRQITCSAEVRVGPGMSDIEAEVQFLMDDDAEDDGEDESEGSRGVSSGIVYGPDDEPEDEGPKGPVFPRLKPGGRQQLLYMQILPSTEKWKAEALRVKAKDYVNAIGGWEQRGCDVFTSCVQSINMGELPDIDALIDKELVDKSSARGRRGKIGKKSPMVKPGALAGGGKPGGM